MIDAEANRTVGLMRYPGPGLLVLGFVLWSTHFLFEPFMGGADGPDLLSLRLSISVGILVAFFITLGLARYWERTANPLIDRGAPTAIAAIGALAIVVAVNPFIQVIVGQGAVAFSEFSPLARPVLLHVIAISICGAFVLPYTGDDIDDDWFVYFTIASLQAAGIGLLIAAMAWAVMSLLGMMLLALAPSIPKMMLVPWFALFCFGGLWPGYTLSALPMIRTSQVAPPPPGRWMRILVQQIAMPGWAVMVLLFYLLLQRKTSGSGEAFWIFVATGTVVAGKVTALTYLAALRDRRTNAFAEFWRRWQFTALLPAIGLAAYALTMDEVRSDLGLMAPYFGAALLWLSVVCVYATLRRQPRVRLFAWAYIGSLLVGITVGVPLLTEESDLVDMSRDHRTSPEPPQVISEWESQYPETWGRDLWVVELWFRNKSSPAYGEIGLPLFEGQPPVVFGLAYGPERRDIRVLAGSCPIAVVDAETVAIRRDDIARPVFTADFGTFRIALQFFFAAFEPGESPARFERVGMTKLMVERRDVAGAVQADCPVGEPKQMELLDLAPIVIRRSGSAGNVENLPLREK